MGDCMLRFVHVFSVGGFGLFRPRQFRRRSGIYLITKGSDSVFWRSVKSGADAAAAEYNVKVTF